MCGAELLIEGRGDAAYRDCQVRRAGGAQCTVQGQRAMFSRNSMREEYVRRTGDGVLCHGADAMHYLKDESHHYP